LLCADQGNGEIPRSLQLIAGRTAQEFNARKNRNGAFWEDRYHATAVQTDSHLARCITYIDLNMVRAHAVQHPRDWEVSGYNEIQNPWQRKRIIDYESLKNFLSVRSHEELAALQNRLLDDEIGIGQRDPIWTESVAVGDDDYLQELKCALGARGYHKQIASERGSRILREQNSCYFSFSDIKMSD
jgi:putative transposase